MDAKDLAAKCQRLELFFSQDETNLSLCLDLSHSYRQLKRYDLAQIYLDKAKFLSQSPHWLEQCCLDLSAHEDNSLAKESFSQALKAEKTLNAYFAFTFTLYVGGEYAIAQAMLELLPEEALSTEFLLLKARVLQGLGNLDQSLELLQDLTQKDPKNAGAKGLLALFYFDINELEKAETLTKQALTLDPNQYEAHLVNLLLRLLRGLAKEQEIELFLQQHPQEARAWLALGHYHLGEMKVEQARQAFLRVTDLAPQFHLAWLRLAYCQVLSNRLEEAEKNYQRIIELKADEAEAWAGLAFVKAQAKNTTEAMKLLAKAELLDKENFFVKLTSIFLTEDKKDKGEAFLKLFPELKPLVEKQLRLNELNATYLPAGKTIH